MPTISLPNGDRVSFPDNMPKEEIQHLLRQKFPDAAQHRDMFGQLARGTGQGVASSMLDISSGFGANKYLPNIPFLGGELPGLPEYARQARQGAMAETEQFANEPSESDWQSAGKAIGGTIPYVALGPLGVAERGLAGVGRFGARNLNHVVAGAIHLLGHKVPFLRPLTRIVAEIARTHPDLMKLGQTFEPAAGKAFGTLGKVVEGVSEPIAGGTRAYMREPKEGEPEPERRPEPKRKSDLEDIKYVGKKN